MSSPKVENDVYLICVLAQYFDMYGLCGHVKHVRVGRNPWIPTGFCISRGVLISLGAHVLARSQWRSFVFAANIHSYSANMRGYSALKRAAFKLVLECFFL